MKVVGVGIARRRRYSCDVRIAPLVPIRRISRSGLRGGMVDTFRYNGLLSRSVSQVMALARVAIMEGAGVARRDRTVRRECPVRS